MLIHLQAAKYKEYDRLKKPDPQRHTLRQSVQKAGPISLLSPARSRQHAPALVATPSRKHGGPKILQALPSPAREPSPTPQAIRQLLGPTPQKDGQILSLFDDFDVATPSRTRNALASIDGNIAATPSRGSTIAITNSPVVENARQSRTPTSSDKRYMLDTFATPMKRKRDDMAGTPSSIKGIIATPSFLRRSNLFNISLDAVDEGEEADLRTMRQPPFKKRGLVRSLSTIIQSLRDQEEEAADEELDMLREMEAEAEGLPIQRKEADVQVEDSQAAMPLGPDRATESDEEQEQQADGLDQNGNPRKIWKKKGMKRQTRRVISKQHSLASY